MEYSDKPLVSIAIALYNNEKSIYRTLESIKNQTYKNFECIIVDDHSTDNGPNIVYNCFFKNDNRFKLIMNITKEQYVDAHNLSYRFCSGKYLFRMDADDIFYPDYLEFNTKYLDEHIEYDAVSSMSHFKIRDENGLFKDNPNEDLTLAFAKKEVDWFNKCPAHSMLGNTVIWSNPTSVIRKCFFDKYKPLYSFYQMGDYLFWYNVLANGGKLHFINEIHSCRCTYDINTKASGNELFYTLTPRIEFILNTYKYKALELVESNEYINEELIQNAIEEYKNKADDAFKRMSIAENSYNE